MLRFDETIGTTANDVFTKGAFTISYGLQNNDVFFSLENVPYVAFAGGTGNDSYTLARASEAIIFEKSGGGFDVLAMPQTLAANVQLAVIDFKHLVIRDVVNGTQATIIDYMTNNTVEEYRFGNFTYTAGELRSNLANFPGFKGFIAAEALQQQGDIYSAASEREAFTFYSDRAQDVFELSQINVNSNAIYRFYNSQTGKHFYAAGQEATIVASNEDAFVFEGAAFGTANGIASGTDEVFRFYSAQRNSHFYTISEAERDYVLQNVKDFAYEGVAYNAFTGPAQGGEELYRFYNTSTNSHFYTTSEAERDFVQTSQPTYVYEGIAYYVDNVI
jgi:Repeat of unknown function (DUF5648)